MLPAQRIFSEEKSEINTVRKQEKLLRRYNEPINKSLDEKGIK
jgi:hypothetical protein